jgi:hypothetical protein
MYAIIFNADDTLSHVYSATRHGLGKMADDLSGYVLIILVA